MNIGFTTEFKERVPTIITASLTLTAALAWNDAIKTLIDTYVPQYLRAKENAFIKLLYAFIITIIIIMVISVLLSFSIAQEKKLKN